IQWPTGDPTSDPAGFVLTLSASVTGIKGIAGLTFSGAINGIQIDIHKLLNGEFPVIGIASFGVEVSGELFGGNLKAALIGGIIKIDNSDNVIDDADITTQAKKRIFYAGVDGSFELAG